MIKYYVLFISILTLIACKKNKSTESLIVGDKGFNYWLATDKDSILYFDYLDKNGKWMVFVSENGIFEKHETPDDVIRVEEWNLRNDSTIIIGESSICSILKLTKDSMILYENSSKREFRSIIAPDSLIPEKYNKLH